MDQTNIEVISVCMVTYKHEKYIKEAIEGVLMQKVDRRINLLIGDDCSPDNTHEIIQYLINNHPNGDWITYIKREKNIGIMPNFIDLLSRCEGKYIALCDGDDYWTDPLKLQKQVEIIENDCNVSLVSCYVQHLEEGELGEIVKGGTRTYLFRNDSFLKKNIGFINNVYHADTLLGAMLKTQGKVHYHDDVMAVWRKHEHGVWGSIVDSIEHKRKFEFQRSVTLFWIGIFHLENGMKSTGSKYIAKSILKLLDINSKLKINIACHVLKFWIRDSFKRLINYSKLKKWIVPKK